MLLEAADLSPACAVGLAICLTDVGQHCGLIYSFAGAGSPPEARLLHLRFHCFLEDVRFEDANLSFRWAQIGLDIDSKVVLAGLLSRVAKSSPSIPYGFDPDGVVIDQATGELLSAPPGKGLTCSTFVSAVLRTYGHHLLMQSSWPSREDDEEWQSMILEVLKAHADKEHVEAVRRDVGAKRIRPDEVVGAATLEEIHWPVNFENARTLADQVVADLAS